MTGGRKGQTGDRRRDRKGAAVEPTAEGGKSTGPPAKAGDVGLSVGAAGPTRGRSGTPATGRGTPAGEKGGEAHRPEEPPYRGGGGVGVAQTEKGGVGAGDHPRAGSNGGGRASRGRQRQRAGATTAPVRERREGRSEGRKGSHGPQRDEGQKAAEAATGEGRGTG